MTRYLIALVVCVSCATSGCGAAAPQAASSSTNAAVPSPTAASASPSMEAIESKAPAKPTPAPTLASTTTEAKEAPPGAISVDMGKASPPRFFPDELTVEAGKAVFFLTNVPSVLPVEHNFAIGPAIKNALVRSRVVLYRRSAVFTVEDLPPGTYVFWCEVDAHAANGMVGSLTVTP